VRSALLTIMLLLPACGPLILRETTPANGTTTPSPTYAYAPGQGHGEGEEHDGDGDHEHEAVIPVPETLTSAQASVDVFPKGSSCGRRSVVVGVHTAADDPDKGFDVLRVVAAHMGADAVIGAEFEHGEGSEPSHLSGMAVRYIPGG